MFSITEVVSPFLKKTQLHSFGKSYIAQSVMTKEAVIVRSGHGPALVSPCAVVVLVTP